MVKKSAKAKFLKSCIAVAILLWDCSPAHAQQSPVHTSPLLACPDYGLGYPLVSDLSWSINCFLQSVFDGNKAVIAELAPAAGCWMSCDSEGILDIVASEFLFGFKDTGKRYASSPNDALQIILKRSSHVLVTYARGNNGAVEVRLIPRPGKASVRREDGWSVDFFVCDFEFDPKRSIWAVKEPFCLLETDSYVTNQNAREIVDLNGNGNESQPVLTWRPRARR